MKFNASGSTIECNPGDTITIESDASAFLQNNFLSQSLDEDMLRQVYLQHLVII